MKTKLIIYLILFYVNQLFSQKETVYSIVKQPQSVDWYQNQFGLWLAETKKTPTNSIAWQNAYIAMRMLKINGAGKTQEDLDAFITKMQQSIPNTYEYHYLTYYNSGGNDDNYDKLFHHLEKAYKLDSKRTEILPDLVSYHLIKGNKEEYKKFAKLWYNSNAMSPNLMNFGYNILASCEDKSVLITNGDNDTYPLFLVQEALGYKADVNVLNIYLLKKEEYRNRIFKELNIDDFTKKEADYTDVSDFMKAILRHLESELKIPLYYSSTTNPKLYEESSDKTYITGLALKYSEQKFDNIAILKNNVENSFKLDYLTISFLNDISQQVVINSNTAYLTGFLTLYKHYTDSGDLQGKQKLGLILTKIADFNPNKEYILDFIKKC